MNRKVLYLLVLCLASIISIPQVIVVNAQNDALLIGEIIFTEEKVAGVSYHVAIYVGNGLVVQAVPGDGVEVLPFSELAEDWAFRCYGGIGSIYRVDASDEERTVLAQYALDQVGKRWVWPSLKWGEITWYCFKLVWRSWYEGTEGRIDLDPVGPLVFDWDLINSPHTYQIN